MDQRRELEPVLWFFQPNSMCFDKRKCVRLQTSDAKKVRLKFNSNACTNCSISKWLFAASHLRWRNMTLLLCYKNVGSQNRLFDGSFPIWDFLFTMLISKLSALFDAYVNEDSFSVIFSKRKRFRQSWLHSQRKRISVVLVIQNMVALLWM